ncbi:MAG: hypothetical protein R6U86_07240 [Bacteroidales bacterium]
MKRALPVFVLLFVIFSQSYAQISLDRSPEAPQVTMSEIVQFDDPPFAYVLDVLGNYFQAIPDNTFLTAANLFMYSNSLSLYAGDMGPDGRYFAADNSSRVLYEVDFSGNTLQPVAPITGIISGQTITGMTYHRPSGTMYFSTSNGSVSALYTINLATGVLTPIGQITNCPIAIDLAINEDGELFTVEIANDNLVKINPTTGVGTIVGPLGLNANFAQSMDFDDNTGALYWAAYSLGGQIRIIDTDTGGSVLVASGTTEYCGLSIFSDLEPPAIPLGYFALLVFALLAGGYLLLRSRRVGAVA